MAEVKADIVGDEVEKSLDAAGRSTQLPEDAWDYDKTGAKEPPYNLEALAYFLEINTWHFRCCKTKAVTTAGLGFDFVVPEGVDEPNEEHKKTLQKFFAHPNEEQTWGEVLENVQHPRGRLDLRPLRPRGRQPRVFARLLLFSI